MKQNNGSAEFESIKSDHISDICKISTIIVII